MGDLGSIPGLGRSPGGGYGNTPIFLPGESHGQRSLASYSSWGCKELDMTEVLILSLFTFKEIQVPSVDIICTTSPPGDCNVVNQILLTNYLALMSAYNLLKESD